jgi:hypothetical protein
MNHVTRSYVNGAVTCGGTASSLSDAGTAQTQLRYNDAALNLRSSKTCSRVVHFTRTTRPVDGFDTELLIESVKKFNEIWDTKCELYHDKNVKRAAWMKICEIFEPSLQSTKAGGESDTIYEYACSSRVKEGFKLLPPSFTIDEQLGFQTEVLNVVKRIRDRSTGFPHPSSHYPCQSRSNARYPNVPSSFLQMQQYSSFPIYPTTTHPRPSASSITFQNIHSRQCATSRKVAGSNPG